MCLISLLRLIFKQIPCIGVVLGTKANKLRAMENKHCILMFFDVDHEYAGCKRLFILGDEVNRSAALTELEDMMSHMVWSVAL